MKGNPDSLMQKILLVESEILDSGIRNPAL